MDTERTTPDAPIPDPAPSGAALNVDIALTSRGIDVDRIRVDESGSIVPPSRSLPANMSELIAALPIVIGGGGDPSTHQLEMKETLGEGGMGEVVLAEQLAMRRQVAVKVQHEGVDNPAAVLQLLREARVTGFLEHPNIVPVHALGRDAAGRPHIIMKRIEGVAWTQALADRPATANDENLGFHVETLIAVTRAVSFAHSRGVLHLDIKPDNVMIGAFGEIYLVDWGVAVRLSDDVGHPEVPLAEDVQHIVGTPHYMAPEMVAAAGEALTPCTDVYLLGACLHQMLSGEPPHDGQSLREVFSQAFLSSKKTYDDRWPRELTAIAQKAMHVIAEDRFASATELEKALESFLSHRHARRLADDARERLRKLESVLDEATGSDDEVSEVDRRAIYDTFSACRFGYELALREWSHNSRALRGMQRCLERMVDFELRFGSAKAAASYLVDLPKPNDRLARAVAAAERHEKAKGKAFERLRRDADVTVGDRMRGVVAAVTGVAWGVPHLLLGQWLRDGTVTGYRVQIGLGASFVLLAAVIVFVGRKVFLDTAANTRLSVSYITVFIGYTVVWLLAARVGIEPAWALALFLLCSSMVWTVLALTSDRRLLPLPATLASTIAAIFVLPAYAFELFGLASLVGPIAVALMWLRKDV